MKVTIYKVFSDLSQDNEPYGVEAVFSDDTTDHHMFEWFSTQAEQEVAYIKALVASV